jgi:hypothetical protein
MAEIPGLFLPQFLECHIVVLSGEGAEDGYVVASNDQHTTSEALEPPCSRQV